MNEKHGFWLHYIRNSKTSVNGFFYLPECDCSCCGATSRIEKPYCPNCHAIMDLEMPDEIKAEFEKYKVEISQGNINDSKFVTLVQHSLQDDTPWK